VTLEEEIAEFGKSKESTKAPKSGSSNSKILPRSSKEMAASIPGIKDLLELCGCVYHYCYRYLYYHLLYIF
jgi:hypothetical protein